MARDFNGTTDVVTFNSQQWTQISITATVNNDQINDSIFPRIVDIQGVFLLIFADDGSGTTPDGKTIKFGSTFSGGSGNWHTPANNWAFDTTYRVAVTYNGSSTANDPKIYKDGVSQTVTEQLAPSGTLNSSSGTCYIGNRAGNDRSWDGMLSEIAIWNRVLSDDEVASIGKGVSALFYPNGLVAYLPLWGKTSNEPNLVSSNTGTISGSTGVAHPRTFYPWSPSIQWWSTVAVADGSETLFRRIFLSFP